MNYQNNDDNDFIAKKDYLEIEDNNKMIDNLKQRMNLKIN